jgi:hypothetical protein
MKFWLPLILLTSTTPAAAQTRPVVLELYTSEACSSCPPAETLLGQLAKNKNILALSFHVTYWNSPAWTDKYALTGATDRQSWYAGLQNSQNVFTPAAIVDGGPALLGSSQPDLQSAITQAQASQTATIPVTVTNGPMTTIKIGDSPATAQAQIWLFGYDSHHTTQIGGGENAGATITETNIVRSITTLGTWSGISMSFTMPKPQGEHLAVILQTATGQILGAAAE